VPGLGSAAADVPPTCAVAAHRGDWVVRTQNGLPAMRSAIAGGADYLETDIRATKDGQLVLMHNARLAKTTNGSGLVAKKTLAQLRKLRLDDGSRIPTLAQFFAVAQPSGVHVLIDMKAMGSGIRTYKLLRGLVNAFGQQRVRVTSFSTARLDILTTIAPRIPQGFITGRRLTPEQVAPYDSILLRADMLTSEWLDTMPYKVFVWTVNDPERWATLEANRLAAVITDTPRAFATWRESGCTTPTEPD
jgi:glycerophosphoryl diester phosphodiesterase